MPDESKIEPNIIPRKSWSEESFTSEQVVVRKFINPAVYVEKERPYMPPTRKTSPLSVDEGYQGTHRSNKSTVIPSNITSSTDKTRTSQRRLSTNKSIKVCTCISSPVLCQCHPSDCFESKSSSDYWESSSVCSSSSNETQITVKTPSSTLEVPPLNISNDNMNQSVSSLSTERTVNIEPKAKEERLKQWLKKKENEEKQKKLEEKRIQQEKERQREMLIEQKKEVHKKWLEKKKRQEEELKKAREKLEEDKRNEEEERLKKQSEGEQMFQAWLKIKKKEELEKKLDKKLKELKEYEDKKKRLEENQHAFHEWIKNSKYKQKPVPLNKGLSSLCSSASVTYVNPEPWVGNVEPKTNHRVQTSFHKDVNWFPFVESNVKTNY